MRRFTIEQARIAAGLTQEELAQMVGVSRISVGNWERGVKAPNRKHFLAILEATGFAEEEMMPIEHKWA